MPQWDSKCCFCSEEGRTLVFSYTERPKGESPIPLPPGVNYGRQIVRCDGCGHFYSIHDLDLSKLYSGEYVDATYGAAGLKDTFDRINNLPPERSDNIGRIARVSAFRDSAGLPRDATLLDIGAGLGVFPYQAKKSGWSVSALDPDPRAAEHIRKAVGIEVICADFFKYDVVARFDVLTLNKVLEHVIDPTSMLRHAHRYLSERKGAFIYIEIPDGESAVSDGPGREEFFIEHHHVFSKRSVEKMTELAGFKLLDLQRMQEPSTKYTLFAFMEVRDET